MLQRSKTMSEFKTSKDERLFRGLPEEYIRLRAKKHRTRYKDPKQADVLDSLADEVEIMRKQLIAIKEQNDDSN